ncbi:two-component system response regulator [Hydrogenovibrio sp. SC-1]|uniref:response regulator transcription factor n=1 Tax=Hydrogenovibrio sp. SC-1 TaxID=2065820 RepID=UPI000C7E1CA2|nr:response regulator [Hydrogenovibrio sp. SC-1]PLA74140.1 two-component system response regulator [Hydrogenovibrio sp. SC-1]
MTQIANPILLVDDDTTFLTILEQSLQQKGFNIYSATSPEKAKPLIATQPFDHAILDLNIDGESGLNLLTELLSEQPDCQVLILTGYASVATAVEAMRLGAMDYLCKPASIQEIMQSLQLIETTEQETKSEEAPQFEPMSVKRMEWEHIQKVLIEHNGNISATAEALNMHRRTLQRKLQKRPVIK